MEAGKQKLLNAIKDSSLQIIDTVIYGTDCTYADIERLALLAKEKEVDMIFGMGC